MIFFVLAQNNLHLLFKYALPQKSFFDQAIVNIIFNRAVTGTGSENSEVVTTTHPSHEPNDPTVEEPNIKEQLLMARAEIRDLRSQVEALKICKFGLERFSTDNDSIKFYTGFPSYHHLVTFYEFVKPCAETMQYCYTNSTSSPFTRPGGRTMALIYELFLFLVRIILCARIMAEEVWTAARFQGSHIVSGFEFENVLLFLRAKLSA